jgi:hypothetical protein
MDRPETGRRIRLSGGYDMDPMWLADRDHYDGTVEGFIAGMGEIPELVVRLDEALSVAGMTGNIVVLDLRFAGHEWTRSETVGIELCDFVPEDKPPRARRRGKTVETYATYELLVGN